MIFRTILQKFGNPVTVSVTTPLHARIDARGNRSLMLTIANLLNEASDVLWNIETSEDGDHWQSATGGDEIVVPPGEQRTFQVDAPSLRSWFRDSARAASGSAQVDTQITAGTE